MSEATWRDTGADREDGSWIAVGQPHGDRSCESDC
jgi:hypothetical protein